MPSLLNKCKTELLKDSAYGNEEDIKAMMDYFDKSTKPIFKDKKEPAYIKFGSMKCNDPKVNIRRGQLMLTGYVLQLRESIAMVPYSTRTDMESFFMSALTSIVATVQSQRQAASSPISVSVSGLAIDTTV